VSTILPKSEPDHNLSKSIIDSEVVRDKNEKSCVEKAFSRRRGLRQKQKKLERKAANPFVIDVDPVPISIPRTWVSKLSTNQRAVMIDKSTPLLSFVDPMIETDAEDDDQSYDFDLADFE